MDPGVEGRRLAIEIIASLVHIKSTMADLLLRPAGVPQDVYRPLLHQRDESTGRSLSKRRLRRCCLTLSINETWGGRVVRTLIEIAATWNSFHLADDEFAARATVQKARE